MSSALHKPLSFMLIVALVCPYLLHCASKVSHVRVRSADQTQQPPPSDSTTSFSNRDMDRAILFFESNQLDSARMEFTRILQQQPQSWKVLYYLGLMAIKESDTRRADSILVESLSCAPRTPGIRSLIYLAFGETWEQGGHRSRALLNYRMALNLDPESTDALRGIERLKQLSSTSR